MRAAALAQVRGVRLRAEEQHAHDQAQHHQQLHAGDEGLHAPTHRHLQAVERGEEQHEGDAHSGLAADEMQRQRALQEGGGAHAIGGDGAGPGDPEAGPAVEESGEIAVGLAQVDVFAASLGEHGTQFGVAQRAGQRQQPRQHPGQQHPGRRAYVLRHDGALQEHAGADHGAHHDGGGIDETQAADQASAHGRSRCGDGSILGLANTMNNAATETVMAQGYVPSHAVY